MNTFDCLNEYYNTHDENTRLSPKRGQVEFLTTIRYIERYLKPHMRILEIGAGTGRYSHYFARAGYAVDAVELIPHNIEIFRKNTEAGENLTITQGNATDLSYYLDNSYDITLLLGPMYHLFTKEDRQKALAEAVRVTKPDGLLFVAYCMNEATVIQYGFMEGNIQNELCRTMMNPDTFRCDSSPKEIFALRRKEDIDALNASLPVHRLHFVGTDMFTRYMAKTVEAMDDKTYSLYLKYHFFICERTDLVGISNHTLDILRKTASKRQEPRK